MSASSLFRNSLHQSMSLGDENMKYSGYSAILGACLLTIFALGTVQEVSAASPSQPTYTPLFTADFENNTVGSSIQEFADPITKAKLTYSNAITGPFGSLLTARQVNQAENKNFGGKVVDVNLGKGKEIWVRWYEYFPR